MSRHDGRRTALPRARVAVAVAVVLVAVAFAGVPAAVDASPATSNADGTQPAVVVEDGAAREVDLTAGQIAAIEADPTAAVVPRGHTVGPALAMSVPTVGAPTMWAQGQRGAGRVIVVIDTGVGSGFGGTLVGQACFAANATGTVGYCGPSANALQAFDSTCFTLGVCGGGDVLDAAAGRPCPSPSTPSACAHGTAVAAVAARHEPTPGVAPDAGVYAIRVFNPQGAFADLADIVLALDHVRLLVDAGLPVAAVNLSVSTISTFVGACDNIPSLAFEADAYRDVFDALLSRGIPTTVASGNGGSSTGIGFPACMSNAVSVGATDLDDDIALFGNRGPGLDLMAPGAAAGDEPADDPRQRVLELGRDVVLRPARRGRLRAARRGLSQGLGGATAGAPRRQRRRGPRERPHLPPPAAGSRSADVARWATVPRPRDGGRRKPRGRRRPRR